MLIINAKKVVHLLRHYIYYYPLHHFLKYTHTHTPPAVYSGGVLCCITLFYCAIKNNRLHQAQQV